MGPTVGDFLEKIINPPGYVRKEGITPNILPSCKLTLRELNSHEIPNVHLTRFLSGGRPKELTASATRATPTRAFPLAIKYLLS